jgi:hypothetical protein
VPKVPKPVVGFAPPNTEPAVFAAGVLVLNALAPGPDQRKKKNNIEKHIPKGEAPAGFVFGVVPKFPNIGFA